MSEREKMQAEELYNSNDPELVGERIKAKKLCNDYNCAEYNDFQKRERILARLLPFKGENVVIEPVFYCDYGNNIFTGDNFYSNHNLVILDAAEVIFGDNVFIGPNCGFYTSEHPIDADTRNKGLESAKSIKVGNDVWIGGNVVVVGGVTIGSNTVIGAGSVVVEDIPSNCVAVGNPCRPIKKIEGGTEPAAEKTAPAETEAVKKPVKKAEAPPKTRRIKVELVEKKDTDKR